MQEVKLTDAEYSKFEQLQQCTLFKDFCNEAWKQVFTGTQTKPGINL
jgi:hypothetical protein